MTKPNKPAVTNAVTGRHDGDSAASALLFRLVTLFRVTARNQCKGAMGRPNWKRAATVPTPRLPPPTSANLTESPLYLLAVLSSARRSKERALENVTRQRLNTLGVRIIFGDELPDPRPKPATK